MREADCTGQLIGRFTWAGESSPLFFLLTSFDYENRGSTKGTEFLLQNTLGYANKSDVNSKQELEVTEKQRIKQLPDEEVQGRLLRLVPKIDQITKAQ